MSLPPLSPFDSLETRARIHPNSLALVDSTETLDFAKLYLVSRRVAAFLRLKGLTGADLVLTALPPRLELVVAMALFHEGIPAGSVIPGKGLPSSVKASWLISSEPQSAFPSANTLVIDQSWIEEAVKTAPVEARRFENQDSAARIILEQTDAGLQAHSISIGSLMARISQSGQFVAPQGPTLALSPLYTEAGLIGAFAELAKGQPYFVIPTRVDLAIAIGRKHKVQTITGSLSEIFALTLRASERKLRFNEVKQVTVVGRVVPKSFAEICRRQLGVNPQQVFGYVSVGLVGSKICTATTNPLIVGVSLPGVELQITNDSNVAVQAARVGYLQVRNPALASTSPDGSQVSQSNDWVKTGDLALLDHNGVLLLAPRVGDILQSANGTVNLKEIDRILESSPNVSQGMVFVVFNKDGGFNLVAAIVAAEGFDTSRTIDYLASKLAPHERPVALSLIEAMPLGPDGLASRAGLSLNFSENVLESLGESSK